MTNPFSARQLAGSTFQISAAAFTNIALAVAPPFRNPSHSLQTLVLPPVPWMPHSVWLYAGSTGAGSTRIFDQFTSSSSAISIGREVYTPCPISDLLTMIVTTSSLPMRMNAFGAKDEVDCADAAPNGLRRGREKPSMSPPPIRTPVLRKERRLTSRISLIFFLLRPFFYPRDAW